MKLSQINNSKNQELTQKIIELVGDMAIPFFTIPEGLTTKVIFAGKALWICSNHENSFTIEVTDFQQDGCWAGVFRNSKQMTEKRISKEAYNSFLALANEEKYQYVKGYKIA